MTLKGTYLKESEPRKRPLGLLGKKHRGENAFPAGKLLNENLEGLKYTTG